MCDSGNLCILLGYPFRCINHHNDDIRTLHCGYGTDNTVSFEFFFNFIFSSKTCRINENIFISIPFYFCINGISCSSGNIRNNNTGFSKDFINQRRFSHIRLSYHRNLWNLILLIFSGMFGLVNVNTTLFIVLFVITFVVLDVFYSLRDISYWGMIPALSSDSHERSTYTALGSFTGSIGYNGITVVVIPIVSYFTWTLTGAKGEGQAGWTSFGIIVGLLGILTAWTVAFGTKESTSALRAKAQKNGNPFEAFKALFQNDQLLWVALSYLLYAIANVATTGVLLFLFKFVLDNQAAYSMTGVIALVAGLIMAPLYPILNKRIPRRVLYIVGMTSMIVAYILLGLFSTNMTVVFIALVLFYIPGTLIQMTAILSLTDSIEYGQLKNGKRNEAVTLSVRPMLDKIGGALSNGITGFIAVAAGMTGNATAADMTPSNIHTFEICAFYVPLILIVLSLLVFMFKVKIDEKMHAKIVKELEAKLASGEIVDDEAQTAETVEAIDEEAKTLTE